MYRMTKKNSLSGLTALVLLFLLFGWSSLVAAESRTKELGVVEGKKSQYSRYRAGKWNKVKKWLKTVAVSYEIIPEDIEIFKPENSEKLHSYKRILIPYYLVISSKNTYAAMKKYVEQGGLLIVRDSLICIGVNNEKKQYTTYNKKAGGNPVVGIYGQGGADIPKFKLTRETPLTTGFELNTWYEVDAVGRKIASAKRGPRAATVVAVSEVVVKGKKESDLQPFLTYNGLGKGVCIYLIGRNYKNKNINKLLKNILSEKTLSYFCD